MRGSNSGPSPSASRTLLSDFQAKPLAPDAKSRRWKWLGQLLKMPTDDRAIARAGTEVDTTQERKGAASRKRAGSIIPWGWI